MKKILIVDDNKNLGLSLKIHLKLKGFEAETAETATNAIQKLFCGKYDAMLIDIKLPDVNGIELANIATSINPFLRVVLMSGFEFKKFESEYPEVSRYARISKPFRMADLLEILYKKPKIASAIVQNSG